MGRSRRVEITPNPDRSPREPPSDLDTGDEVREPPPGNDDAKHDFPSDTDLIDPGEDGGRIKKQAG